MAWIVLGVTTYAICGVLDFGFTYAYFQRAYPSIAEESRTFDRVTTFTLSLLGPIGLVSSLFCWLFLWTYRRQWFGFKYR